MLLNESYFKTYRKLFPGRKDNTAGVPIENVIGTLQELGFRPVVSRARKIRNLRKDALIVIRWKDAPDLSHAAVWDNAHRKTLDPWRKYKRYVYESQIETIYYVDVAAGRRAWKKRR
jgi:hypothetical protein